MRVLFWSLTFWPNIGGIEVLAAKVLPVLRERGHEFLVVASNYPELPDEAQYEGIPIHRFSFQNKTTPPTIDHLVETRQKVANLKRTFAPDLIHINGVGLSSFFHLTTNHADRASLLVTLHGAWDSRTDTIVAHTLRAANWVAGCSAAVLERGQRLVPEIAARSSIIYNGLEVPPLAPKPLPFDPARIVCLGRLTREKGFDLALAAFVSIVHRFPEARLIIAGDGPLRTELQHRAAEYGIDHAVDFIGWVAPDRVPCLINASTMVVMPSREDSLPLVALEAALMARPVVAARVGGLPEIVLHQETGLLVEKENSLALAHAISFLMDNPDVAARMGKAGRQRVETVFSLQRHVDAYDCLYKRLAQ